MNSHFNLLYSINRFSRQQWRGFLLILQNFAKTPYNATKFPIFD